jgi:hypothetical protein
VSEERLPATELAALAGTVLWTLTAFNLPGPREPLREIDHQPLCLAPQLRGLLAHAAKRVDVIPRVHTSK